ncbi:MAG: hypothetical protein AAGE92_12590, partial [Cyanobacteria bacterium P01_G01_bin.4]
RTSASQAECRRFESVHPLSNFSASNALQKTVSAIKVLINFQEDSGEVGSIWASLGVKTGTKLL